MDFDEAMSVVQESHLSDNQYQTSLGATNNIMQANHNNNIDVWIRSRTQEEVICHVVNLVNQLYHSSKPEDQTQANRQLIEVQSSSAAWDLCWPLLDPNINYPVEVRFFASNTIVVKINQNWYQLEEDWLKLQLRPKLVDALVRYAGHSDSDRIVIERLSLALAVFTVRAMGSFWTNAIEDILQTFQPQNLPVTVEPKRIVDILLRLLSFIPEEYSSIVPHKEQRAKLSDAITQAGASVFRFIQTLLITDENFVSIECKKGVINCCTSWTHHSLTSLLEQDNHQALIDILFNSIANEELCKPACAALAATYGHNKANLYRQSLIEAIIRLAQLDNIIERYRHDEDNAELVVDIYSLVINFSDNHSRLMLDLIGNTVECNDKARVHSSISQILAIILRCTSAPGVFPVDEKYSDTAFSFWYSFQEDIVTSDTPQLEYYRQLFTPLIQNVVEVLLVKVQFPTMDAYHSSWSDDQKESHRCYRQDIGDTLSTCYGVLQKSMLAELCNQLDSGINHLLMSPREEEAKPWQKLEAALFGVRSIAEHVPYDEDCYLTKIFESIARIPFSQINSVVLYCTASEMVAAYFEWLYYHQEPHLATSFSLLLSGLKAQDHHVHMMATLSLKDLTKECQAVLKPYAPQILASCFEAVQPEFGLRTNERARLMCCIGHALAILPNDQVMDYLTTLLRPILTQLQTLTHQNQEHSTTTDQININKSHISDRLIILAALMESLKPYQIHENISEDELDDCNKENPHPTLVTTQLACNGGLVQPVFHVLQQLLPLLESISQQYKTDEDFLDVVGSCVRKSARTLQEDLKPLVGDILRIFVTLYNPRYNPIILETLFGIYTLFRSSRDLQQAFRNALCEISERTVTTCISDGLAQQSHHMENYFRFAQHALKKIPIIFTLDEQPYLDIASIYKWALASLTFPEKRTVSEVSGFIITFICRSAITDNDRFKLIVVNSLEDLLIRLMEVIGGIFNTPRASIDQIADILISLVDNYRAELNIPVKAIIEKDDFPTKHLNKEQKSNFLSLILKEKKNKRKCRELCQEMCLVARNLTS